jgi:hypothetical protein
MEDVIETNRELVMSVFAIELGRGPSERPHTVAALEAYLSALVRALRHREREEPEALRIAREHGAKLARMHYDVGVLLREFVSLRTAIVAVLRSRGTPSLDDIERLTDFIHVAMFASTREFLSLSRHVGPTLHLRSK